MPNVEFQKFRGSGGPNPPKTSNFKLAQIGSSFMSFDSPRRADQKCVLGQSSNLNISCGKWGSKTPKMGHFGQKQFFFDLFQIAHWVQKSCSQHPLSVISRPKVYFCPRVTKKDYYESPALKRRALNPS